ncbi:MAG: C45 family peptidase [Planctomycetota bacterium]|jgi:hypothetical protein
MRPEIAPVRPLVGALFLTLLATGCGEREVGGFGRLSTLGDEHPVPHVVVSGTPYEMGYWQGRLLRDRIASLHEAWQELAFSHGAGPERAKALRASCRVYASEMLKRMPEALRQELQGLADGSGVDPGRLLLTAVLRDGLRFHDGAARLLTAELSAAPDAGLVRIRPYGEEAARLADAWVLVERRPRRGERTLVWTWPGSLGGVAGVAGSGLVLLSSERALPVEEQRLADTPFTVLLRRSLERATRTAELIGPLEGSTGHLVVAADLVGGACLQARVGLLPERPAFVTGADATVLVPEADAAAVAETIASADLPFLEIDGTGAAFRCHVHPSADDTPITVEFARNP